MGQNSGKSVHECIAEVEAEAAWQRHLTDPAEIRRSRYRVTALRNRIQKLNEEARSD
jgi:predicted RNase H-like nuclease (RuvC/YqgF family)